jgi:hypothetical protein
MVNRGAGLRRDNEAAHRNTGCDRRWSKTPAIELVLDTAGWGESEFEMPRHAVKRQNEIEQGDRASKSSRAVP